MKHWPFIAAAYGLGCAVPIFYALGAMVRLRRVRRRLIALEAAR